MAKLEPASIRYKNPGAQWPGPVAKKFGSTKTVTLNDGQGNKIAVFDTFEQGAAAQFYLWSTKYSGMTLEAAIHKWSGHNSSKSYADHMKKAAGVEMTDVITKDFLASDKGWRFMKAQAQWEAGKAYPMTDEQWIHGQAIAFGTAPVPIPVPTPKKPVPQSQSKPEAPVETKPKGSVNLGALWRQISIGVAAVGGFLTDWKMLSVVAVTGIAAFAIWVACGKPKVWQKAFWA